MCAPALSESRAGVWPRSSPSMNTCTPAGLDCTSRVPIAAPPAAPAGLRIAKYPPTASARTAAAAYTAGFFHAPGKPFFAIGAFGTFVTPTGSRAGVSFDGD